MQIEITETKELVKTLKLKLEKLDDLYGSMQVEYSSLAKTIQTNTDKKKKEQGANSTITILVDKHDKRLDFLHESIISQAKGMDELGQEFNRINKNSKRHEELIQSIFRTNEHQMIMIQNIAKYVKLE